MAIPLKIVPVTATLDDLDALRKAASDEGFRFIERLYQDWHSSSNRFDKAGECLLLAWSDAGPAGIAGLNRDPYTASQTTGRLRHLYVRNSMRRNGVASALLKELLAKSARRVQRRAIENGHAGGRILLPVSRVSTRVRRLRLARHEA
jgi:GNAT superfamily N-acetyltransferase